MSQLYEPDAKKKLVATIVCLAVIAIVVVLFDQSKTKATTAATTQILDTPSATTTPTDSTGTPAPAGTTTPSPATASSGAYKNGTYTASSSYGVPHGSEDIQVKITLKDGVITASSVQNSENDHDSARYQEDFTSVYQSSVIGKNISGLQIDVIAGASDTTDGFNQALSQIASQAKA